MEQDIAIFDSSVPFDPSGDFDTFLQRVPGKWVVYLFTDVDDRPVQLLCVKNLRASLKRRLGGDEQIGLLTRRVNYRDLVRHVHWRRVDSALEADWIYYEAARRLFPQTYQGMVGFRPAWFVHVNPATQFPRYTKTIDPSGRTGIYFGPIEDKHAAQKLVEQMESMFDLCRDYSILVQSPKAGPCAWRQMGKCVGPCDGSISLDAYRQLIAYSARVLSDPQDYARQQTHRMEAAAGELKFELAQKIKAYVDQISRLWKGPLRHCRPLGDFRYVTVQRGPRAGTARVFLIAPGRIDEIACLIGEPSNTGELLRSILDHFQSIESPKLDQQAIERMGIVAHHLFSPKKAQGVFLPLASIDDSALHKAWRDLQKQKLQDESEGEGVMKELQAIESNPAASSFESGPE